MTHYETLGVQPDASPEEIKAAYRVAASKAHPDKPGGSDEAMQKVNRAHDTLRDPQARQRYDETGSDREPPSIEVKARSVFAQMLEAVIESESALNLVDAIKGKIKEVGHKLDGQQVQANRKRERLTARRAKVRTKDGAENLVHGIIDAKLEGLDRQLQAITESRAINQFLLGMVDAHEDDETEDIGGWRGGEHVFRFGSSRSW